jgi:antitoxin ParD1/3/4
MTMHVSLTPQLEEIVKRKVDSGLYNSSSEVVREAIRLLDERDRYQEMKLEALRHEIQLGLDSGEARPVDFEDIKKRGRERLKQAGEKK